MNKKKIMFHDKKMWKLRFAFNQYNLHCIPSFKTRYSILNNRFEFPISIHKFNYLFYIKKCKKRGTFGVRKREKAEIFFF